MSHTSIKNNLIKIIDDLGWCFRGEISLRKKITLGELFYKETLIYYTSSVSELLQVSENLKKIKNDYESERSILEKSEKEIFEFLIETAEKILLESKILFDAMTLGESYEQQVKKMSQIESCFILLES